MGTTNINILYRPIRIGFLIPDGDIDGLVKAATINSLLWGGINNPMIPIGADTNQAKNLIEIFNVDTIFPINDSIDMDKLYDKYSPMRHAHLIGYANFLDVEWQVHGRKRYCLDIHNIIDHIWNTRTHSWPSDKKSHYIKVSWNVEDTEAKVFPILFGAFPEPKSVYEQDFFEGLHSDTIDILPNFDIPSSINDKKCLIQLTSYQLQTGFQERHNDSLYIGSGNSFEDLLGFWNLRAAGIPMLFYNYDNQKRWSRFIQAHLEKLHEKIQRRIVNREFEQATIPLYYYSIEDLNIEVFCQSHNVNAKFTRRNLKSPRRNHLRFPIKPIIPYLQERVVLANVERGNSRYEISCELPPLSFTDPNDQGARLQHFVAVFSPYTEFAYPLHTIRVPLLRGLLEDIGRDILFDPHNAVLQEEGIGLVTSSFRGSENLYPISYDVLVERVLRYVGIKSEPSQAGILAKTLVEQLGGLEGSRVLKIRGVRKLIKAYSVNDNFDKGAARCHINDSGDIERFKSLYIKGAKATAELAFDTLLEKGLIRTGLDLRCAKCHLSNWLSVNRLDESWSCEYCGEKQPIATLLASPAGKWRFRKSGLLGKDNNQEGAIPVLLTLLQLKRILEHPSFVYSAGLNLTGDNIDCEIDLCILQYVRHEQASWGLQSKLEIGIGECKDDGGSIDDNDAQKLKEVYRCLNTEDIRCYLIFSKAADNFSEQEILLFKTLKKDGIPLILFTNNELEPYEPYEKIRQNNTNFPIANTLKEMSWISDSTYLSGSPKTSTP
jgi:hypothetical protein